MAYQPNPNAPHELAPLPTPWHEAKSVVSIESACVVPVSSASTDRWPLLVRENDDARKTILAAISWANEKFEFGITCNLFIVFKVTTGDAYKQIKLTVLFDKLLESDEVINVHTIHEDLHEWIDGLNLSECEEEKPILEGMSYVHMSVIDEDNEGIVGRVTTCITPDPERSSRYLLSFSFCRANDLFSRRRGRMIARNRLANGDYVVILNNGMPRFDMVRTIVEDFMKGGSGGLLIDQWPHGYPQWLRPSPPKDLRPDVSEIIMAVAESKVNNIIIAMARDIIDEKTFSEKKYVMHRDNHTNELDI